MPRGSNFVKHGGHGTPLYFVWKSMRQRCADTKCAVYPRYGGRGITVCAEWNESYIAFRDWALANGYSKGLTIERKKNDEGYEPANCKWATYKEQNNNARSNVILTFNGESHTMAQWAEIQGLPKKCLKTRIRLGWTIERALTEPRRIQ